MLKRCSKCGDFKTIDCFSKNKGRKDGLRDWCRLCVAVANKAYRIKRFSRDPEKERAYYKEYAERNKDRIAEWRKEWKKKNRELFSKRHYKYNLYNKYGLTEAELVLVIQNQNGKCAICYLELFKIKGKPHIDHDHITGQIRGVLCSNCNIGIGFLKDSPEILLSAISYLQKNMQKSVSNNRSVEESLQEVLINA